MTSEKQHDVTTELNEALAGAFESGNFDGLVPFYTMDASLMPPRGGFIAGRADIATFWNGVRNRFTAMTFTTNDVKAFGETVRRETGTYVLRPTDLQASSPGGKYLFLWHLVDGEWQIESSIWNRNAEAGGSGRRGGQGAGLGGGGRQGGARQGGTGQGGTGQGGAGQGGGRGGIGAGRPSAGQGRRGDPGSLYDQSTSLYSSRDD